MDFECPLCKDRVEYDLAVPRGSSLWVCSHCTNPILIVQEDAAPRAMLVPGVQDVRSLAPPESLAGRVLADLDSALDSIPLLPEISQRVIACNRDDDSSMSDLAEIIKTDPVIAAKVLQAANSAMYRGLSEITDFVQACTRLGQRTVGNVVQTLANGKLFSSDMPLIAEHMRRLHRHSVATAFCAGEIGRIASAPNPDSLYLAGLIHDVGKVVLYDVVAHTKGEAAEVLRKSPELLLEIVSGFHGLIGLHVVCRWNLPNEFRYTTYGHHIAGETPVEDWRRDLHIVALANDVAKITGYGSVDVPYEASLMSHPSALFLNMTDVKLANLRVDMEEKFEELADLLIAA